MKTGLDVTLSRSVSSPKAYLRSFDQDKTSKQQKHDFKLYTRCYVVPTGPRCALEEYGSLFRHDHGDDEVVDTTTKPRYQATIGNAQQQRQKHGGRGGFRL